MRALLGVSSGILLLLKFWPCLVLAGLGLWWAISYRMANRRADLVKQLGKRLGPYYGKAVETLMAGGEKDVDVLRREGMASAVKDLLDEMPRSTASERWEIERTRRQMEWFVKEMENFPETRAKVAAKVAALDPSGPAGAE